MHKFITFGCWNKRGCVQDSPVRKVTDALTKNNDIEFFIVNGDNYYQDKTKDTKIVNNNDLLNGLKCLNRSTENDIFLLLGNHDLEITNTTCETLLLEKAFTEGVNSQAKREKIHIPTELVMFKEVGNTLIIMIDSNLYADENPHCFKILQNNLKEEFLAMPMESQLQFLKQQQQTTINNYLTDKTYKNLIVCAHHPLIGFKNQVVKKETKNGKLKEKVKGGLDIYNVEMYRLMLSLKSHGNKFYYMCADIHNYQEGMVSIEDNGESLMTFQQYIVGTGGADLDDDYNEKYSPYYGLENYTETNSILTTNIQIKEKLALTYSVKKHWSNNGFIIVSIDAGDNVTVEPIQIPNVGGRTRRICKTQHKIKYKKRKTIKRKY
jgi:hypothetical protein